MKLISLNLSYKSSSTTYTGGLMVASKSTLWFVAIGVSSVDSFPTIEDDSELRSMDETYESVNKNKNYLA